MKKIIITLVLLVANSLLMAQTNSLSLEEFTSQVTTIEKSISENFKTKNYEMLEKLLNESITLFSRLSDEDRQTYKLFQANNYYNLACAYSLQNKKKAALDAFETCINDWGYANYSHTKVDSDLDNIRKEKRFIKLMESIREKGDYVYILKQAGKYEKADTAGLPRLAIMLNECYLSTGFKSRYVTCMPKDENDQDCHVINSVYSETLQKWIWMDPTFNAYVKDENGNFLGIEEVRERLVNDRPLVLSKDANWNNENPQTKEKYLDSYMAKNLYWLECTAISKFNPESRYRNNDNTYISLMPVGYEYSKTNKNQVIVHDPGYFWQKP
jgi:hypothetical protein